MPVRLFGLVRHRSGEIEAARSKMTKQVYMRVGIPNAAVVATPSLINS